MEVIEKVGARAGVEHAVFPFFGKPEVPSSDAR